MIWNLFTKRDPENALKQLCSGLQAALGSRLKSLIVFGSYVRGDFDPKRSNVNVLIVSDLSFESLERLSLVVKRWMKIEKLLPVLSTLDELDDFARDFPIEFLDMQEHHRVLCGESVLSALKVDKKHLESQLEHDLAVAQLRLRQVIILEGENLPRLRQALTESYPSVATLFRAASRLSEKGSELDKIQAEVALKEIRDVRRGTDDPEECARRTLELITNVLEILRKQ